MSDEKSEGSICRDFKEAAGESIIDEMEEKDIPCEDCPTRLGLESSVRLLRVDIARLRLECARLIRENSGLQTVLAKREFDQRQWESENGQRYEEPWK